MVLSNRFVSFQFYHLEVRSNFPLKTENYYTGADPGFPMGGANPHWRGRQPLTKVLFGENISKNERIWSCWGGARRKLLYVDLPLL